MKWGKMKAEKQAGNISSRMYKKKKKQMNREMRKGYKQKIQMSEGRLSGRAADLRCPGPDLATLDTQGRKKNDERKTRE